MFRIFRKNNHNEGAAAGNRASEAVQKTGAQDDETIEPADTLKDKIVSLGDSPVEFASNLLSFLAKEKELSQAIFFTTVTREDKNILKYLAGYAFDREDTSDIEIEFGEGFTGQAAADMKPMIISDVPEGYLSIVSGLGKSKPASVIIVPLIYNKNVIAVIELASFRQFTEEDESYFKEIASYAATHFKKIRTKR